MHMRANQAWNDNSSSQIDRFHIGIFRNKVFRFANISYLVPFHEDSSVEKDISFRINGYNGRVEVQHCQLYFPSILDQRFLRETLMYYLQVFIYCLYRQDINEAAGSEFVSAPRTFAGGRRSGVVMRAIHQY
jgi:hypothetical protein